MALCCVRRSVGSIRPGTGAGTGAGPCIGTGPSIGAAPGTGIGIGTAKDAGTCAIAALVCTPWLSSVPAEALEPSRVWGSARRALPPLEIRSSSSILNHKDPHGCSRWLLQTVGSLQLWAEPCMGAGLTAQRNGDGEALLRGDEMVPGAQRRPQQYPCVWQLGPGCEIRSGVSSENGLSSSGDRCSQPFVGIGMSPFEKGVSRRLP